jgi:hypothetical protein
MIKEFEQFMKQKGACYLFIKNLKKDINIFFNEYDPCDYLAGAFVFEDSPEDKDYWNDLQDEWDKYCKNIK